MFNALTVYLYLSREGQTQLRLTPWRTRYPYIILVYNILFIYTDIQKKRVKMIIICSNTTYDTTNIYAINLNAVIAYSYYMPTSNDVILRLRTPSKTPTNSQVIISDIQPLKFIR